jgi:hypothetical protein
MSANEASNIVNRGTNTDVTDTHRSPPMGTDENSKLGPTAWLNLALGDAQGTRSQKDSRAEGPFHSGWEKNRAISIEYPASRNQHRCPRIFTDDHGSNPFMRIIRGPFAAIRVLKLHESNANEREDPRSNANRASSIPDSPRRGQLLFRNLQHRGTNTDAHGFSPMITEASIHAKSFADHSLPFAF